jgi:glutamyl-tRNA synthetase
MSSTTAVQIQLFQALAAEAAANSPITSLLVGADGQGPLQATRLAVDRRHARERGIEGDGRWRVFAALIGTSESVHPVAAYEALLAGFDLAHVSRGAGTVRRGRAQGALNARLVSRAAL